jgi:hypothetical protein
MNLPQNKDAILETSIHMGYLNFPIDKNWQELYIEGERWDGYFYVFTSPRFCLFISKGAFKKE